MSKTIEEIEKDYILELGYKKHEDYPLMLTKLHTIDASLTLHKFMTEVAERYAQSQTQEIKEQNAELVDMLGYIFYKKNFQSHFPTTSIKVKNLLTKYQQKP